MGATLLAKMGTKNGTLGDTFISPTYPKNNGTVFGFKCLPVLDGF